MPAKRAMIREAAFAALFAVVATVSVVSLLRSAGRPFGEESFSLVQWVLFGITMAGAGASLVRSLRYYAALAAVRRVLPDGAPPGAAPPERGGIWERLPTVLDDASWVVVACFLATVNVLGLLATIRVLGDLGGDPDVSVGWLIWQLAVLVACTAALTRFTVGAARELLDRARRRRRNAIHVVTGRLLDCPGEGRTLSPARRAISCALTVVLAATAWATGSGPLLDGDRGHPPAQAMSGKPGLNVARARPPGSERSGRNRPRRPRRRDVRRNLEQAAADPPAFAAAPAAPVARPIAPRTRAERRKSDRRAPKRRRDRRTTPEDRQPAPPAPTPPEVPATDTPGTTYAPPAEPPAPPPGGGMVPCPDGLRPELAPPLPPCGGISAEGRREPPAGLLDTPRP